MADMQDYIVVADAINVTTGKMPDGKPEVTRMVRGETLHAPSDHRSVIEFLHMGGIVRKADARDTFLELANQGTKHRPTVVREEDPSERPGPYRITGWGVTLKMADVGDIVEAEAALGVEPVEAPEPELGVSPEPVPAL